MATIEKIRRLRGMSLSELRFRFAQKVRIERERVTLARNGSDAEPPSWKYSWSSTNIADPVLRDALPKQDGEAEAILAEYLANRKKPCFYFSPDESTAIILTYPTTFPNRIEEIVDEAERLCAHRMRIFAFPEVNCGAHIPWRADMIHGIESGLKHWSRIPFLDFRKVGDSKVVWEPNRHQHLITLALSYRLTGTERYAEECFAQWEDWQRENPYLRGINWASSLELAFRAWSWTWIIHLLAGSPSLSGKRLAELTRALDLHADFIAANLSTYYSPNTHLLGEGFALFVVGLLFPELRRSAAYRDLGRTILLEEITKQVREDGSHVEQSTSYHRYATDFFLCAAILADRNECAFPDSYRVALERMVDFIMHTAWPNGSHPMLGDADGGSLLSFARRDPNDYRSTLSTAAVYFEREDFRDRAGELSETTLWLLGPSATFRFRALSPKPPAKTSHVFANSGLVVMRSDWQSDANMLLFDAGPQGMGDCCGHGHADALSIVCSAKGTNWLVDPGTFAYTTSSKWRDYFRSTRAHNTIVVDGKEQAEPLEAFKWLNVCPARLERWATVPHLDFASGSHGGYRRLTQPVVHRRRVVFVKPDRWFLLDDLSGLGTHSLEFFFHFPPDVRLHVEKQVCRAIKNGSHFLVLADPHLSLSTTAGEQGDLRGWYSQDYGHREPAPVLIGNTRCSLPSRFPWVLWPEGPNEALLRQLSNQGSGWVLETSAQMEYFIFSDPARKQSDQGVATDSEFAYLRQERSGQVTLITLLDGSWLNLRGAVEFRSQEGVREFDLERHGDSLEVHMRPVLPFTLSLTGVASVRLNGQQVEFKRTDSGIAIQEGN